MGSLSPEPTKTPSAIDANINTTSSPQSIFHVVHFRYYAHIPPSTRADVARRFLALQSACILPRTRKPYIRSFTGGRDVSVEDLHKGFHAVFILEFASQGDRDWYVHEDPVHRNFGVGVLTGVVEEVMVVDFRRGEF
ncbi:uncharacterized protein Z519_06561 [Cladophialophora bantiana CBS 173.52]|uniref:Stress-response A/B barrel domain-containing protein n=1 Tax=Cladophialophora bantiana (strain ATCC 10958 / CBS 173.52 / CDC B-1940 / NIH 8579) TaxID=1442370 RepID=A0A0D2HHG8_CLAB1|nr:uncharacterized protein Z519_06561 [Cladophialophora bantiana CBS 173.52]KIW92713.1 hypothetical protein Z519_06561 [Cladophialophora bantiana CBS 173.52]